jgi:hypothetical protein
MKLSLTLIVSEFYPGGAEINVKDGIINFPELHNFTLSAVSFGR